MRKDCVFSTLTEEQQADLFDWLTTDTYKEVLKRIAQAPPKGFGIRTHTNSLWRFYQQRQAQIRGRDLAALPPPSSTGQETEAATEPRSFYNSAHAALAHSTYVLAHSPLTPAAYRAVANTLQRREDALLKREFLDIARQQLALARERLQFDRTQFEYNASRAAIALLPELIAIDQMSGIDEEAKIWRVRDRLFGSLTGGPASAAADSRSQLSCQGKGEAI